MENPGILPGELSRREFLLHTGLAGLAMAVPSLGGGAERPIPPIVVFSKVYQELNLDFEEAARLTAEAGLNGVDCPVRPKGEIPPERAADDLPKYVAALQKYRLEMPLITTAIIASSSPRAEEILRTAKKVGVKFYRLGFIELESGASATKQIDELRAGLKELAVLNKQIGIGALVQNHSPAGRRYLGGDLNEMREIVAGFDPAQVGVAFDIGHALVVHGQEWRRHFNELKPHIKIAYVKDVKPKEKPQWVPFGQGELETSDYFKMLMQTGYRAPVSLHIEFDWSQQGKERNRAALLQALKASRGKLAQWLSAP